MVDGRTNSKLFGLSFSQFIGDVSVLVPVRMLFRFKERRMPAAPPPKLVIMKDEVQAIEPQLLWSILLRDRQVP